MLSCKAQLRQEWRLQYALTKILKDIGPNKVAGVKHSSGLLH